MTNTSPLRKIVASFGFEFDPSGAIKAQSTINNVVGAMGKLATVGAGIVIFRLARELAHFAVENVKAAKELGDTSNKLGIAANKLELFDEAAQENGATTNALTVALRKLAVTAEGTGKGASKPFAELGVKVKDVHGKTKPLEQLFVEVGTALAGVENNTKRTAIAQKLFGRSGTELLGVFSRGKEGTKAYFDELSKLSGGFSDEFVKASTDAVVAEKRFQFTLKGLTSEILVVILPAITRLINGLSSLTSWFTKAFKYTNFLRAGWLLLGAVGARLFGRILLPILWRVLAVLAPIIAKWLILQLILDDIITFLTGGESVIGAFLDALFGVGTAIKVCKELNGIWDDFVNVVIPGAIVAVKDLWTAIKGLFSDLVDGWLRLWHDLVDGWLRLCHELPGPVVDAFNIIEDFLIEKVKGFFGLFDDFFNWLGKKFDLFGVLDDAADAAARAEARARDASPKDARAGARAAGVNVKAFRAGAIDTFGGFHQANVKAPLEAGQAAANVVRIPAPQGTTVNQNNDTTIHIDARGAKDPNGVKRGVEGSLRKVHTDSRNAALNAVEHRP